MPRQEAVWFNRESLGFVSERHPTLPFPGCAIVDGPSVPLIQLIDTQLRNPNQNYNSMAPINRKFRVMACLCLSFLPLPSSIPILTPSIAFFLSSFARRLPSRNWKGGQEIRLVFHDRLFNALAEVTC